jgi:hypothetical protein
MKPSEVLQKSRERIQDPEHWIKGKTKDGDKYCMIGAVAHFSHENGIPSSVENESLYYLYKGVERATNTFMFPNVAKFNDNPNTKHEQVLKAYDCAIELAQKDETVEQPRIIEEKFLQPWQMQKSIELSWFQKLTFWFQALFLWLKEKLK